MTYEERARKITTATYDFSEAADQVTRAIAAEFAAVAREVADEWRVKTESHLATGQALMDGISALYPSYIGQGPCTEVVWINKQTLGELQARSVAYEEYRKQAENAVVERDRLSAENAVLKAEVERLGDQLQQALSQVEAGHQEYSKLEDRLDALSGKIADTLCAEIPDGFPSCEMARLVLILAAGGTVEQYRAKIRALVEQAAKGE